MGYKKDTPNLVRFGARLKEIRLSKGYSQEGLADHSGISYSQLNNIEKGKLNTSLTTVFILSKTLQMHVKELFEFDFRDEIEE